MGSTSESVFAYFCGELAKLRLPLKIEYASHAPIFDLFTARPLAIEENSKRGSFLSSHTKFRHEFLLILNQSEHSE